MHPHFVTPAKAGVQTSSRRKPGASNSLDTGFRRYDGEGKVNRFLSLFLESS